MLVFAIIVVGVGFFILIKTFGGMRELQNATESGNLNVAKMALKAPAVNLTAGVEQDNFGGLVDDDGTINLRTYNRLVGQVLLVALNAQSQATPESRVHAQALIAALQAGSQSIGQRLTDALSDGFASQNTFDRLAEPIFFACLDRMHRLTKQPNIKPIPQEGESANVYLDPTIIPSRLQPSLPQRTAQALPTPQASNISPDTNPSKSPALAQLQEFRYSRTATSPRIHHRFCRVHACTCIRISAPAQLFQVGRRRQRNSSQSFLRAISCSIVGALASKLQPRFPRLHSHHQPGRQLGFNTTAKPCQYAQQRAFHRCLRSQQRRLLHRPISHSKMG